MAAWRERSAGPKLRLVSDVDQLVVGGHVARAILRTSGSPTGYRPPGDEPLPFPGSIVNHDETDRGDADPSPEAPEDGAFSEARLDLAQPATEIDLNVHIFTVSAGLVGVCLTVIGIIRIAINVKTGYTTIADDLLAVNSFIFMASCLLAYSSLRTRRPSARTKRLETYADRLFIVGLAILCATCALVAFELL